MQSFLGRHASTRLNWEVCICGFCKATKKDKPYDVSTIVAPDGSFEQQARQECRLRKIHSDSDKVVTNSGKFFDEVKDIQERVFPY